MIWILLLLLNCTFHSLLHSFSNTQYKNSHTIEMPELSRATLLRCGGAFSIGNACNAFNAHSKRVPFLQQYGHEDMLQRFTDATLSENDTTSLGKGLLTGKLLLYQFTPFIHYNCNDHWAIQAQATIEDLFINNIQVTFDQKTDTTNNQKKFLYDLHNILTPKINHMSISQMNLLGVYNYTFDNFTYIDFIDITIKSGIITPSLQPPEHHRLFNMSIFSQYHFQYPLHASIQLGFLDWISCGINGSCLISQPTHAIIPINHNKTENTFLISKQTLTHIEQDTSLTCSCFVMADHILDMLSFAIEYKYYRQGSKVFSPVHNQIFPYTEANTTKQTEGWTSHNFSIQAELDYAGNNINHAPIVTINYTVPLQGKYISITSLCSGSFALQICYQF